MLRLEGFGGANLLHESDAPPQRRRIALLALLAVAGNRGMSREKLVGYLWPESTVDHARHSLEQLIYGIRRTYGDELLIGGNPLHANPEVFSSDVGDFEQALSRGELARAVEMYRGPFLDGLFIPDAPEFERWASSEAQRLGELAASAFESLATAASREGHYQRAVAWLRKRAALDPTSARGATLLMQSLADAGDTTSALQHAAVYERLVRQELDADPDPSVINLAEMLRSAPPVAPQSPPERTASSPPREVPQRLNAPAAHKPSILAESPDIALSTAPIASPAGRRANWWIISGIAASLLLLAFIGYRRHSDRGTPSLSPHVTRIAVIPFHATVMDSSLSYLGEGMTDLVSARFTGEGGPVAVDPRAVIGTWRTTAGTFSARVRASAVAVHADEVVEGELIQTSTRNIVLNARLSAVNGNVLARESVQGPVDSIARLSDELGNRLLARRAGEQAQRLPVLLAEPNAAITAFLQGRAQYRKGDFTSARAYFSRALAIDSTFAEAALELGLATGGLFQWSTVAVDTTRRTRGVAMGGVGTSAHDQWARAIEIATRDSARLSAPDRVLLIALRGGYPRAIYARQVLRNWENAAQVLPDLPDAHFWLGHVLLFQGGAMGIATARPRAKAEFARALEIDPSFAPALRGMIEAAALDRDLPVLRQLTSRYLNIDAVSSEALYVKWRAAGIVGDSSTLAKLRGEFATADRNVLERIRLISQLDGVSIADAERANNILLARAIETERQVAFHAARQIALNNGQPSRAVHIGALKRELEPNADLQQGYAIRDGLFWDGDSIAAITAVTSFDKTLSSPTMLEKNNRRTSYMRFSRALWRLSHNDTTGAGSDVAYLRQSGIGRDPQAIVLDEMLANLHKRPDAGASLARLDSLASLGFGATPHVINLVSARIHEQRGEISAALAAIRRGRWYFPPENLTTYLREEGRLAAHAGDRAAAARALSQYLMLRSKPEPSLKPQADSVRTELARLTAQR
jgi:DNA-binding SARP family transcriptional activator/TolB-like protein